MVLLSLTNLYSMMLLCLTRRHHIGAILFGLSFATTVGLLNSRKLQESDLKDYVEWFNMVGDMTLPMYLFVKGNDYIYFAFNYFFYHYISSNPINFIFGITFISYLLIFATGYIIFHHRQDSRIKMIILCIMLMSPLLFINSGHLVRQLLAASVVTLSVYTRTTHPIKILLIVVASLIHSSALIFLVFQVLATKIITLTRTIVISVVVVLSTNLLALLPFRRTGIGFFDVILSRLIEQDNADLHISLLAISLIVLCLVIYYSNTKFQGLEYEKQNTSFALLCICVLLFYLMPGFKELSLRYSYYAVVMMPIFFGTKVKIKTDGATMFCGMGLLYFTLLFYSANNQWDFSCGFDTLFNFDFRLNPCTY
jgi:hypothetical protein